MCIRDRGTRNGLTHPFGNNNEYVASLEEEIATLKESLSKAQ